MNQVGYYLAILLLLVGMAMTMPAADEWKYKEELAWQGNYAEVLKNASQPQTPRQCALLAIALLKTEVAPAVACLRSAKALPATTVANLQRAEQLLNQAIAQIPEGLPRQALVSYRHLAQVVIAEHNFYHHRSVGFSQAKIIAMVGQQVQKSADSGKLHRQIIEPARTSAQGLAPIIAAIKTHQNKIAKLAAGWDRISDAIVNAVNLLKKFAASDYQQRKQVDSQAKSLLKSLKNPKLALERPSLKQPPAKDSPHFIMDAFRYLFTIEKNVQAENQRAEKFIAWAAKQKLQLAQLYECLEALARFLVEEFGDDNAEWTNQVYRLLEELK